MKISSNSRTTNTAIAAVISYVIMIISQKAGLVVPIEVREAIIMLFLVYGLHQAESKPRKPRAKKSIKNSTLTGLALVLIFCVSFNGTCSRSKVETVYAATKQVVEKLEVNANLPQVLFDEGLIDEAKKLKLQKDISDATILARQLRDDLKEALQTQDPGSLANVATVLANLIELVRILRVDGEQYPKLEKHLVKIEASLRIVSIFFRDNITPAVSPMTNIEYAKQSPLEKQKALELRNQLQQLQQNNPEAVRLIIEFAE